jgi:hypothetical protein
MSKLEDDNTINATLTMEHLEAAYHATTYRVFSPPIEIRTGAAPNALDQLLEQYSAVEWAFISAWNPMSQQLTPAENETAHQQLLEAVAAFPHFEGAGVGDDGLWEPERSLLILGINFDKAVELGRLFRQQAIVCGEKGGVARLVMCF